MSPVKWEASKDLPDEFFDKLVGLAEFLRCSPVDMARVMMNESGINPKAKNPNADANGLIQFMGPTLAGLGWAFGGEKFRELSAVDQLSWVKKYYEPKAQWGLESAARLYLATFLPALMQNNASHSPIFVLCGKHGPLDWAYGPNRSFDQDGKGYITVGDLEKAVERACKGARWTEVAVRIAQARQTPEEPDTEPSIPNMVLDHIDGIFDADEEPDDKA